MKVSITNEEYDTCYEFATKVVGTNVDCYRRRNQSDIEKIKIDILVGKLAEVAGAKLLEARGLVHTMPDFAIYEKKHKSFDSDLLGWTEKDGTKIKEWNFHVKCMKEEMAKRFGLSWSFQVQDDLVTSPRANDHLILCQLNNYYEVDVKTVVDATLMGTHWKNPMLTKLHGIKKVLYWRDLEKQEYVKKL